MQDLKELEQKALKFWPSSLMKLEQKSSIVPKLIETQDKFISLLNLADASPFAWKEALHTTSVLPANLFLKHLMVLSDIGGEKLMRFRVNLPNILCDNTLYFKWRGASYSYRFSSFTTKNLWNNTQLKINEVGLQIPSVLSDQIQDVAMLIMFGGLAENLPLPIEIQEKCIIGSLIGESELLDTFVRQRYIWVSRITGGAASNKLGNLAQQYVLQYLQRNLIGWDFSSKSISGISQNDRTLTSFDMVVTSPKGKTCAIEATFQVTTNSVIERKAGQALARQQQLHALGHKIAYVIDGAGNFQRSSALKTICQYSDCTVTYHEEELARLAAFLIQMDQTSE
ncbi:MAG: restriction endonuclease [Rhodothermia bacterium]|nr:restriction endonuclease [Rhodothermia bacterium]